MNPNETNRPNRTIKQSEQDAQNLQNEKNDAKTPVKKTGGLYAKVNMSLKTANIMVLVLALLLVAAMFFVVTHNGFTVRFDTDGGSYVESQKVFHSELITLPEQPVREGYIFDGWYLDRDCTVRFDPLIDTVTQSMTLYAGWKQR